MDDPLFWERPLEQLNQQQWEALYDGCGRCCLQKLQHQETQQIVFSSISCEFLNTETCADIALGRRFFPEQPRLGIILF